MAAAEVKTGCGSYFFKFLAVLALLMVITIGVWGMVYLLSPDVKAFVDEFVDDVIVASWRSGKFKTKCRFVMADLEKAVSAYEKEFPGQLKELDDDTFKKLRDLRYYKRNICCCLALSEKFRENDDFRHTYYITSSGKVACRIHGTLETIANFPNSPERQFREALEELQNDESTLSEEDIFNELHKAAVQGYTSAQNAVGICYQRSIGCEKDLVKASFWFQIAADDENKKEVLTKFRDSRID